MATQRLDPRTLVQSLNELIEELGKGDGPGESGGLTAEERNGRIWVGDEAIGEMFDADGADRAHAAVRDWVFAADDLRCLRGA